MELSVVVFTLAGSSFLSWSYGIIKRTTRGNIESDFGVAGRESMLSFISYSLLNLMKLILQVIRRLTHPPHQ